MDKWRAFRSGEPTIAGNAIKLLLVAAATLAGTYIAGRAALIVLPFLIGLSLALMLDKPMRFLSSRLRIGRTIGAGIGVAMVVIVLCGLFGALLFRLYVEVRGVIVQLPQFYNAFTSYVERLLRYIGNEYDEWLTPELLEELEALFHQLRDGVLSLINRISRGVWNTAVSAPQIFIGFMMLFFSAFFFLRDRDKISGFVDTQIPASWTEYIARAKKELFISLFAYIRAILILACITFFELIFGFAILDVRYGILIAFICAMLDALPAIGTGWVLTPWGIICIVMGHYKLGIGLLVLYVVTWIVRQLLEPRIVGGQIGMHPLILLAAMYIGMQFFGVIGLLAGPLCAIVLRSFLRIYSSGRSLKELLYDGVKAEDGEKQTQEENV